MAFRYQFNEQKATQAAAFLIAANSGQLNYMKLIKLLYLANRKAFQSWGRPIVPDEYFSLPHGPILSRVLALINEELRPGTVSYWKEHISAPEAYKVKLTEDPGRDELSKAEMEVLQKIFMAYRKMDEWKLVDWCHKNLTEWKNPGTSCIEIEPQQILSAVGWTVKEIKTQIAEEEQYQRERRILQQV